ncbi:MAG: TolC family protein [Bacteroidota bacterium]|nr:TolC family protein [Bacteroidota bacterium]
MNRLLIIITFLSSFSALGQDSLSLKKAIEIGLQKNFDIQLTQKNVAINQIMNSWGEAGSLPQININVGQNNSISDQRNNPISFAPYLFQSSDVSGNLALNWTIFNGFGIQANKNKLEQLQIQSENTATLAIENTIHGIILSYYQAKMQKEQLNLIFNLIQLSKEKYDQQVLKSNLGVGVKFELLQYENNLLADSSSFYLQELAFRNSIRNLNLLMGADIEKEWILSSEIKPELNDKDFNTLKNEMLANNTNIKNQFLNISLNQQDISIAKSSFYPNINLNAGTNTSTGKLRTNDANAPIQAAANRNLNYYANFTLNFRLFDGGKVRRAIKALEIQNEMNQTQLEQMQQQLILELSNTFALYQTRKKIFELNKKAFIASKENLEIARFKEKTGLINSFNFRDIEMNYLSSGVNLYQSSFDLLESNATLLKLTGKIIQD